MTVYFTSGCDLAHDLRPARARALAEHQGLVAGTAVGVTAICGEAGAVVGIELVAGKCDPPPVAAL